MENLQFWLCLPHHQLVISRGDGGFDRSFVRDAFDRLFIADQFDKKLNMLVGGYGKAAERDRHLENGVGRGRRTRGGYRNVVMRQLDRRLFLKRLFNDQLETGRCE